LFFGGKSYVRKYIKVSLTSIILFHCRTEVLRWQVPQIILFYHRDEVQVPQVHRLYGILVGYGSESVTILDRNLGRAARAVGAFLPGAAPAPRALTRAAPVPPGCLSQLDPGHLCSLHESVYPVPTVRHVPLTRRGPHVRARWRLPTTRGACRLCVSALAAPAPRPLTRAAPAPPACSSLHRRAAPSSWVRALRQRSRTPRSRPTPRR
jgi:hypothetical protein